MQARRGAIVGVLLFSVFAGTTVLWLWLDRTPPQWDDAWYLANNLTVYDSLCHGGIASFLVKLNSVFGFKAPLTAALPSPFYLIFGRRWHAAFLVNIASMALLLGVVYRIARRFWSTRAAILAIAITGTMPMLYGLARWFMVEYALTALVAAAVCILLESGGLETPVAAILFGVVCGLGALVIASMGFLVLAGPWYLSHFRRTIDYAIAVGFGEPASIATYFGRVIEQGVSIYYFGLMVLLAAWVLLHALRRDWSELVPLLLWLAPFVLFLFSGNSDIRYIAPVFARRRADALRVAGLCCSTNGSGECACGRHTRRAVSRDVCSVSFGIPLYRPNLGYARKVDPVAWPRNCHST
jgi:hypothetical protein